MTAKRTALLESLTGQLVVSCQAASGSPLEPVQHIVALAQAAVLGGAKAVRIEGVGNVAAVRAAVTVPIIGIVKAMRADSDVFITTTSADVVALSEAGADIIAFDATRRPRPETVASLCGTVQQRGRASMADISAIDEAKAAIAAGADLVGTTLSGYTDYSPALEGPDFELMQELRHGGVSFAAEGRIWTPDEAARAIALGARSVVVRSAITRPDVIARRFSDAVVRRAADLLTIGDRGWAGSTASQ
jgi:N-acylglucosamine-6-phosphate 2-epimerase